MWAVLFAGVQAFVFAWSAQGLVEADEGALMLMSVVVLDIACLAAAHLSLSRRAASSRLMLAAAPSDWTAYRVVSVFVALTALAAAAALCVLAVELPHNFALEQVNAKTVFVEWELLYAALVGLYFLGQRHAVLPSLVPVASMGIGVAEHFVFLFKGQPIQPGDMLAIGTAAAVSDGYVYTLSAQCLWGLTAGVAALLVCVVLARFRRRPEHFSDHQPYLTQGYNDLWYPGEDAAEHARRVYQTDYVVWANYDIAGCDQVSEVDDVSASFMASEVAQLIGAPLTSFQKAHIELRRALPEISAACYEDAAGGWFLPNVDCGIDATDQARADFATMQFYDLFRDGQGIYSSQLQDEPNVDPVAR